VVLIGQEVLEAKEIDVDDVRRWEDGVVGTAQDAPGRLGAAAGVVVVEEVDNALETQFADLVGVGAVFEDDAEGLALQGLGFDDGCGWRQVGMGTLEALDVDDGAGPDAVELAGDVVAGGTEGA